MRTRKIRKRKRGRLHENNENEIDKKQRLGTEEKTRIRTKGKR